MAHESTNEAQLQDLLLQALETERGGIKVYAAAIEVVRNDALRREWQEYLEETQAHEQVLTNVLSEMGIDPETPSPGRYVVAHHGQSLVGAIRIAREHADPVGAELIAGECVVLAETKDHLNWELIGHVARHTTGETSRILQQAFDAVEQDEQQRPHHATGWTRELWKQALGFAAALPPQGEMRPGTQGEAGRAGYVRNSVM